MAQFDITLVGEANLDLLLYGLPEELAVEREWIAPRMTMTLGGSPAITAHNVAALGSSVGFITPVAGDAFSGMCLKTLEEAGVELRTVGVGGDIHTGVSILLEHAHSRRTLTYTGATASLRLADIDFDFLTSSRHFHFSSYFLQEGLKPEAARLLEMCKRAGLTVSVDMNDDPTGEWDESALELLRHVDIFMPNEQEVCRLMREPNAEAAIHALGRRVPLLVVKRGKRGAMARRGEQEWVERGVGVEVVDAVGAGDSFNAGFLHGFLRGWPVGQCLRFGNVAGAYSTTAQGGIEAFRDRERWQEFVEQHFGPVGSPAV